MTSVTAPVAPPTPLARNRNFGLLWFGEGVSVLGSMTTTVVFPLVAVTEFHAGPLAMGLLAGAVWLPWLVLGLPVGALVDRSDPRGVMMAADAVAALTVAMVPLAWVLGVLTLAQIMGTALVLGGCTVFFRTAYTAFVPRVVRPDDLGAANARIYGTESAMQVAGPGVGGLLVQAVSAAGAVVVDAVSFVVSWACLARMRPEQLGAAPERRDDEPLVRQVRDGVRIVVRDPFLRFFALQGGLGNFALTGYGALMVLFLARDLRLQPSTVGTVIAVGACGGLLGATVAGRTVRWLGDAGALRWLQVVGGPPALLVGLASPGWGVVLVPLGSALVGLGVVGANVVRASFRARYTPADLLGRTTATMAVLNFGTMPVAGLVSGVVGELLGVRETILLMASVNALGCLAVFVGPFRRGRELPREPMQA
jgi:MFS family permease